MGKRRGVGVIMGVIMHELSSSLIDILSVRYKFLLSMYISFAF